MIISFISLFSVDKYYMFVSLKLKLAICIQAGFHTSLNACLSNANTAIHLG